MAGAIQTKEYTIWWLVLIGQWQEVPSTLLPDKLCLFTYKIRAQIWTKMID